MKRSDSVQRGGWSAVVLCLGLCGASGVAQEPTWGLALSVGAEPLSCGRSFRLQVELSGPSDGALVAVDFGTDLLRWQPISLAPRTWTVEARVFAAGDLRLDRVRGTVRTSSEETTDTGMADPLVLQIQGEVFAVSDETLEGPGEAIAVPNAESNGLGRWIWGFGLLGGVLGLVVGSRPSGPSASESRLRLAAAGPVAIPPEGADRAAVGVGFADLHDWVRQRLLAAGLDPKGVASTEELVAGVGPPSWTPDRWTTARDLLRESGWRRFDPSGWDRAALLRLWESAQVLDDDRGVRSSGGSP